MFQLLVCHSIMDEHDLPFKVNDLVEVRSYIAGYRGAWFRCKVFVMCAIRRLISFSYGANIE